MKTKEILLELIEHLDAYENENAQANAELTTSDFLGYLNTRFQPQNVKVERMNRGEQFDWQTTTHNGPSTDISILIVLLFRYAKGYMKKALKDSRINSADEFSYLMSLMVTESLNKSELIQNQIMEKTSGTDIINRLIKQGLVEQYADENDKRSVRIKITPSGRSEIIQLLPQMRVVSQIVVGNLSETEKNMLAYMLRKLEVFHNEIFMTMKSAELAEIVSENNAFGEGN